MAQVLVAEGDAGIREAIQAALEDEGHHIMTAANGAFALTRLLASADPLVVLVNERLSDIGGLAIQHMAADVRIGLLSRHRYILMTALPYCLSRQERSFLRRHGIPILPQPFELDDLLETVTHLEQRLRLVHQLAALQQTAASYGDAGEPVMAVRGNG